MKKYRPELADSIIAPKVLTGIEIAQKHGNMEGINMLNNNRDQKVMDNYHAQIRAQEEAGVVYPSNSINPTKAGEIVEAFDRTDGYSPDVKEVLLKYNDELKTSKELLDKVLEGIEIAKKYGNMEDIDTNKIKNFANHPRFEVSKIISSYSPSPLASPKNIKQKISMQL